MWANFVVVASPGSRFASSLFYGIKPGGVEQFLAHPAVEGLDVRIVSRLTRPGEVNRYLIPVRPLVKLGRCKLAAIVAAQCLRFSASCDRPWQCDNDVHRFKPIGDLQRDAFSREGVDD